MVAFYRYSTDRTRSCITVCNFTPVIRNHYIIGVNQHGDYRELVNTDNEQYGGSGQSNGRVASDTDGNACNLTTLDQAAHNRPASLSLTLPPLGVLILEYCGD